MQKIGDCKVVFVEAPEGMPKHQIADQEAAIRAKLPEGWNVHVLRSGMRLAAPPREEARSAMPNIKIYRYNETAAGYIEPEDKSWILFIGLDGAPLFYPHRAPDGRVLCEGMGPRNVERMLPAGSEVVSREKAEALRALETVRIALRGPVDRDAHRAWAASIREGAVSVDRALPEVRALLSACAAILERRGFDGLASLVAFERDHAPGARGALDVAVTNGAPRYECVPSGNRNDPDEWFVEGIDYDCEGVIYSAVFYGTKAKERAEEYAAWKNGAGLGASATRVASVPPQDRS